MNNLVLGFKDFVSKLKDYPLTIMSVYFVTFFVYRDFGIRMIYGQVFLTLILVIFLVHHLKENRKMSFLNIKLPYILLSLITLLIFIRPDSLKDKQNFAYIILMLITTGFLVTTTQSKDDIRKALKVFIISATVFSIIIIFFQIFQKPFWDFVFPILSPTAQVYAKKYFFSGYSMSLGGISFTLYVVIFGMISTISLLLFMNPSKKEKYIYRTLVGLYSLVILLSGRRGELGALLISFALFYILKGDKKTRISRLKWLFLGIIVFSIAVVIFLPLLSKIKFLHRYTMTLNAILHGSQVAGGVSSGRVQLYQKAWELFLQNPIFGIGHGKFTLISSAIHLSAEGKGMDVHNSILQLLAETGVTGLFLVVTPFIYIYWNTMKDTFTLWNKNNNEECPYVLIANSMSLVMQTFILITSMVDPINYKIVFWLLYYISFYLYVYSHTRLKCETFEFESKFLCIHKD
ncbi:O-antigen ligase domain-containing protein [Erysipelothrix sp. strain 2 (EsS2-7-Brazil)]|uniref:O-antigen ligase family protein n=1 Tax=Erysipelothrix sp. strain 2 (EsS2-7-Brazil) TaxID=2500579 RepID=UPI00190B29C3|nr:O-antigen ligase family protein [Erysipelothrix sp. strain 2 (EsS2-7-Brazil)]MBK2404688.1 O-antigen ligase domain-containing protein [Erysipelothrix sp. strain 2 (EsS2-7-Brazil)]